MCWCVGVQTVNDGWILAEPDVRLVKRIQSDKPTLHCSAYRPQYLAAKLLLLSDH